MSLRKIPEPTWLIIHLVVTTCAVSADPREALGSEPVEEIARADLYIRDPFIVPDTLQIQREIPFPKIRNPKPEIRNPKRNSSPGPEEVQKF